MKKLCKVVSSILALSLLLGIFAVGAGAEEAGPPGVVAQEEEKVLVAAVTEITIKGGEYIAFADLVQGTTWDLRELSFHCGVGGVLMSTGQEDDSGVYYNTGFFGQRLGTATVTVTAPDKKRVEIEVTVKYTLWNWFQFLFLGAWRIGFSNDWGTVLHGAFLTLVSFPILPLLWLMVLFS